MKLQFHKGVVGQAQYPCLYPEDDHCKEWLNKMGLGEIIETDIKRERNPTNLRRFWKLCELVADATGNFSKDEVAGVLKIRCGLCNVVETGGEMYRIPKSIAFGAMDEIEFGTFLNLACKEVCIAFLPHMNAGDLRNEVEKMVGIRTEHYR